jgi:hypothetical protein
LAAAAQTQETRPRDVGGLSVPRFPIAESPIALSGDVRAWLGTEDGDAELWVHPLELADRFGLAFRIPDYDEPVPGESVARSVEIRPELMTITYSHATFTVREHILAPHDEPGLLVLLDVESIRPLEIQVQFRTLLQYAWPGALGGQYAFWDQDQRAFILSESLRRHNAVIGSPWAESGTTHAAHALPDAPSTFSIPVDLDRAGREFIPIAAYASVAPRDSVLAGYRRLIGNARELYEEKRRHIESLLARSASIDTPDDRLDTAFAWSVVNLDEQLTCNPDLGCGLVAGWGPSGESARPGFGWFFGGDAAINTLAMDLAGLWPQVADGLRFLARYQRDDGKITHEISQAAAAIPWFTEFPYAYYHADTTPYWILAVWRYWRASGDEALLEELWPDVLEAYGWCLTAETDGDGIIENTVGGLGAVEVGAIGAEIHQDIYLAGVWIEALRGMSEMAAARGDNDLAGDAEALLEVALATLEARYWREDAGHYAFGILRSGETNDALTVWPATAGAFGLFEPERGRRNMRALAGDAISSDWGARMLASTHELFDPMGYNMGAVWPFVTGFVSWGQYRYRRPWSGFPLIDAVSRMTFDWARGRHPELLSGAFYRPLDTTVPHQFFATSMLVTPFLAGVLGWEPDAPGGRAQFAPQLPAEWDRVAVRGLAVGQTRLDVTLTRGEGELEAVIRRHGPPVTLDLVLSAPAGAREVLFMQLAGDPGDPGEDQPRAGGDQPQVGERLEDAREIRVSASMALTADETRATLRWEGGLEVEPPRVDLEPGQTSQGLRVLDLRAEEGGWTLVVEGTPGESYEVRVRGEPVRMAGEHDSGVEVLRSEGLVTRIRVAFEVESTAESVARSVRRVRLAPEVVHP